MKKAAIIPVIALAVISLNGYAQNLIINGSFEMNSATANMSNLTYNWANYVSNSYEVDGGTMDLITADNCGLPSDGNWFVRTSPQAGLWPYLAFSLKLNTPVAQGQQYTLSFDKLYCGPNTSPVDIGLTADSIMIGTIFHTFPAPTVNSWTTETYTFQAPVNGTFLTVNVGAATSTGQVALDKFVLTAGSSGIEEPGIKNLMVYPNPSVDEFEIRNLGPLTRLEIFDLPGNSLWKSAPVSGSVRLAPDFLSPGIYILQAQDEKGRRSVKLIRE